MKKKLRELWSQGVFRFRTDETKDGEGIWLEVWRKNGDRFFLEYNKGGPSQWVTGDFELYEYDWKLTKP